jgi:hypothetical protein
MGKKKSTGDALLDAHDVSTPDSETPDQKGSSGGKKSNQPKPKPAGQGGKGGGGGKGNPLQTPAKTDPGKDQPAKAGSGAPKQTDRFSDETRKAAEAAGLSVAGTVDSIKMSPGTRHYMQTCDEVYTLISRTLPSAARCMDRNTFMHCCRLFWARRIEDAYMKGTGQRLPPQVRAPLPPELTRLPMPIYDILMSIGLWKDDIHSLLYIPKPCMPDAGRLVDCTVDYLDDVGSCIAYDW